MNYDEYVKIQVEVHGMIKKPLYYRIGQRKAIDWFFQGVDKNSNIYDIGCGEGTGLKYLRKLGYTNLHGIDLNPKKVLLTRRRGFDVACGDILTITHSTKGYDVIWMSHSLEHMLWPNKTIDRIKWITKDDAEIFIIVPYPDVGPTDVHCASEQMGTRLDDDSKTFRKWLVDQGLEIIGYKYDDFREKEIWVQARKRN